MAETVIAVVGGICGILSIAFNVYAFARENTGFLSDFISIASNKEFIIAKIKIYRLADCPEREYFNECKKMRYEISYICNFFNNAGIMVYKHRLPSFIFSRGGWGYITVRTYEILEKYIENERILHDKRHSHYFEWLYKKIKKSKYYKQTYAFG